MKKGFLIVYVCLGILAMSCVPPSSRRNYLTTTSGATQLKDMEKIPSGTFQMGGSDFPARTVYVNTFYIDKYMVTNAAYKKFVDANPEFGQVRSEFYLHGWNGNNYPPGKGNHPVLNVDWWAAMAYAKWVGKRLPTEAEWEKAARGGFEGQKYPWGNLQLENVANLDIGRTGETTDVLTYPPNPYGLYDMVGNGAEWCLDEYVKNPREKFIDPVTGGSIAWIISNSKSITSSRVVRGGIHSHLQTVDSRTGMMPGSFAVGFRCATN